MTRGDEMSPWLIGGPGRCGKTHLALSIWNYDGPVAGFPLEGLFTVFSRRLLFTRRSIVRLLGEYLSRPRYTNASRTVSERPLDYLTSSLHTLCTTIPDNRDHPILMIDWVLDRFARENDCKTWAAFDLHPEFRFRFFRKHLPNLKLAIMTRDPREAVCAALFWRGDPGDLESRATRFKTCLILYCLAAHTGQALSRRWPDVVRLFNFNRLVEGDSHERHRIAESFRMCLNDVNKSYDFVPEFDFDPNYGFLSPNGDRVHYLDDREFNEISALTGTERLHGGDNTQPRQRFLLFARLVFIIGRSSPALARAITDFAYYPRRYVAQRANRFRQLVNDLRSDIVGTFIELWNAK